MQSFDFFKPANSAKRHRSVSAESGKPETFTIDAAPEEFPSRAFPRSAMTPASASDARRCQSSRVASRRARGACGIVSARTRAKLGERVARHGATPTRASRRETSSRDARGRANDGMLTTRLVRVFAKSAPVAPELPNPRENSHGVRAVPRSTTANILAGYSAVLDAERGGVGRSRQVRRGVCARNARASTRNNRNHHVSRRQQISRQRKFRADFRRPRCAGSTTGSRKPRPPRHQTRAGLARARSGGRRPRRPA